MPQLSIAIILFCFFCLSIVILLWYYLYYFYRIAFYEEQDSTSALHPITIIVCVRNEDHNLPEFLPLILTQEYKEFEVIVVDDCSWDNTPHLLRDFEEKYSHLKVITIKADANHSHGKKFALMVGIKGAKYDHLLLTDGDCRPTSNKWLHTMVRKFTVEKEIVLGYSKYEKMNSFLNKLIRFDAFHIGMQYLSFALAGTPYMGIGRNLAYKKSLFFNNKGFSTHYHIESGDDDLFINEVANDKNTTIEISEESFTESRVKNNFKDWIDQKKRHLTTWTSYKASHKVLLGVYPFAQILFWLLFIFLLCLGYNIYIVLGLFVLKIVVQLFIYKLVMDKLKESDLWLISLFGEIFLLLFYPALTISNSLYRRPKWKTL